MVNIDAYPWFYKEQWPEDWRPCVQAIRSGVSFTLADETQLTLTLKLRHTTQSSQFHCTAVYADKPFTLQCGLEHWQLWIHSWLAIENPEQLPETLKNAAYALTLEPIAQLFTSLGLETPVLSLETSAQVHTPYVCFQIQKPGQAQLNLCVQGLTPDTLMQLCSHMKPAVQHSPKTITLPLSIGINTSSQTHLQNMTPKSIVFFDTCTQISEHEIYLFAAHNITKLRLEDNNRCTLLDSLETKGTVLYASVGEASFSLTDLTWAETGSQIPLKTRFYNTVELVQDTEKIGLGRIVRLGEKVGVQLLTSLETEEGLSGHS